MPSLALDERNTDTTTNEENALKEQSEREEKAKAKKRTTTKLTCDNARVTTAAPCRAASKKSGPRQ
jgi:hypothetical protein